VVDEALLALVPFELVVSERVSILSLGGLGHCLCHPAVVPLPVPRSRHSMKARTSSTMSLSVAPAMQGGRHVNGEALQPLTPP